MSEKCLLCGEELTRDADAFAKELGKWNDIGKGSFNFTECGNCGIVLYLYCHSEMQRLKDGCPAGNIYSDLARFCQERNKAREAGVALYSREGAKYLQSRQDLFRKYLHKDLDPEKLEWKDYSEFIRGQ